GLKRFVLRPWSGPRAGAEGQAPAARIEAGALREARPGVMKVCRARTAAPTAQGWGWTCETDTEISIPMLRARADSIRSMVRPTSTGAAWTAGPDITITSMPRALVADQTAWARAVTAPWKTCLARGSPRSAARAISTTSLLRWAAEAGLGCGLLVQAARAAAFAGGSVGVDDHVVQGGAAARGRLQGPAVLQDRQPQARIHVHRCAQPVLGLLAAPEAAQGRAD